MRRKQLKRGGQVTLLLASLTLFLTGCSTASVEDKLRFGWPRGVTKQAKEARVLWTWTGVTALALGVIVWGLIFWCCIRYRKKSDELPRQTKYNFAVEAVCFTFPFIVIAGLFYRTVIVEDDENKLSANPDVRIQVNAFRWNWQFEYTSYRGVAGQQSPKGALTAYTGPDGKVLRSPAVDTAQETRVGASQTATSLPNYLHTTGSQYEVPVLVIPVNQTVQIDEHSEDVLHSFWVPEFLFKRDVVPYGTTSTSQDNAFEFTATQIGHYVGRCAELCGVLHSQMNFEVRVVSQNTFKSYLAALNKIGPNAADNQAQALRATGQDAYATTTNPFNTVRTARKASTRSGS